MSGLSDEHQEMVDRLEKFIGDQMKEHEIAFHDLESERIWYDGGSPVSTAKMVRDHIEMKDNLEQVANAFLGTPLPAFMGGGRRDDGVISIVQKNSELVKEIHATTQNGASREMKLKLPASIWVAVITTIGLLAIAVIEALANA